MRAVERERSSEPCNGIDDIYAFEMGNPYISLVIGTNTTYYIIMNAIGCLADWKVDECIGLSIIQIEGTPLVPTHKLPDLSSYNDKISLALILPGSLG
jgi:hypothetical protein